MDIISFMIVVWAIKVFAEDTFTTVKGQTNPRIERRRARQRSRANNPVWTQFVGWLGDLAEDGRQEQARKRRLKREKRGLEERQRGEEQNRQPEPAAEEVDLDLDDPKTPDPEKTDSPPDPDPDPDPEPEPEPIPAEPTDDDGPTARVIPLFGTKKENEMSTSTGEATGLVSAMNHAEAMEKSFSAYAASGDAFVASLQNGEVSGAAIAAAMEAREHEEQARRAWARCRAALAEQLKVKEAYNATPGAGSREFVTAE